MGMVVIDDAAGMTKYMWEYLDIIVIGKEMETVEAINPFDEYNKLKAENNRLREEIYDLTLTFLLSKEKQDAEIEQLRLANSDLQMYYDYAKTECDKLQTEVLRLRGSLSFISMLTPLDGQSWESHARFINAYALDQLEEKE